MENEKRLIPLELLCAQYQVELSFISTLREYGMIEIVEEEEIKCVPEDSVGEIEKILHLYYDLDINLEGIDAIRHLLTRISEMQREIRELRGRVG